MSRRFRFRQVDVFTDRALQGNPLAVFPDADDMSDEEMQAVAREMMLSETTFVTRATAEGAAAGADYRVRIFTTTMELPFAGHPLIGTGWVLAEDERVQLSAGRVTVHQEVSVGILPLELTVSSSEDGARVSEITLGMAKPELIYRVPADELDELAETLEVRSAELRWPGPADKGGQRRAPAVISCGLPYLVVPFSRVDLLADLDASHALALARFAETYGADSAALVAPGNSGAIPDADVHVRVLSDPRTGTVEDAATGSAAGPICIFLGYLAGRRGAAHRVVIEQGVEMGRPSRLVAEADFGVDGEATAARVSGQVVPVIEGWVELP
ncbi:MAG: PhzF family phenazine biosynthesis protein [Candidatus Limnocylindrales bacterium]